MEPTIIVVMKAVTIKDSATHHMVLCWTRYWTYPFPSSVPRGKDLLQEFQRGPDLVSSDGTVILVHRTQNCFNTCVCMANDISCTRDCRDHIIGDVSGDHEWASSLLTLTAFVVFQSAWTIHLCPESSAVLELIRHRCPDGD